MRDAKNDIKRPERNQDKETNSGRSNTDNNMKIAKRLLGKEGIELTEKMDNQLHAYLHLIRDWNSFASLVSQKDLELLEKVHVPDSLSLAPLIRRLGEGPLHLLDIGSGGGFPAIPLKIVLPELEVEMVERGARKVGFIEKVAGSLHLGSVQVVQGNFPEVEVGCPQVVTARAVEKPGKLLPHLLDLLPVGGIFLCQTVLPQLDARFHVERVLDDWTAGGLRRGDLHVIRRVAT